MAPQTPRPPLRVLSLDGGGIRGLSSLHILEHIMEGIRDAECLDEVPKPCDRFDLIGGTSTGGIIAIMLGRLGMTVDECIKSYRDLAEQAFTPKPASFLSPKPKGLYSATKLEEAIRKTVRAFCPTPECAEQRGQGLATGSSCRHGDAKFRDATCTATVVLAATKANVDTRPTLLTTYDNSTSLQDVTIWEIARATSAAPIFFKSIRLGRDDIEFVDAAVGYNNPCEVLIEEAQKRFPGRELMPILSIGTGKGDVAGIGKSYLDVGWALKRMATSSQQVASRLDSRFQDDGRYFHLNVDRGLEDTALSEWKMARDIATHTKSYMRDNERLGARVVGAMSRQPRVDAADSAFEVAEPAPSRTNREFWPSPSVETRRPDEYQARNTDEGQEPHDIVARLKMETFARRSSQGGLPGPVSRGNFDTLAPMNTQRNLAESANDGDRPNRGQYSHQRNAEGSQRKSKYCDRCNEQGHDSRDKHCSKCRRFGHNKNRLHCYKCNGIDHYADDPHCFRCNGFGHMVKACPERCFECGSLGHWIADCPELR